MPIALTGSGEANLTLFRSSVLCYFCESSEDKGEGNGTPLQYSCLENPIDGGAWWAAVHGVAKSWTTLSDFTFTFHFPALEKAMATHSSVLAWRIPGTGEPPGLPSMGSHRVGHDWSNLAAAAVRTKKTCSLKVYRTKNGRLSHLHYSFIPKKIFLGRSRGKSVNHFMICFRFFPQI